MALSRRAAMIRGLMLFASAGAAQSANAETATYAYDAHGRLISVTFSDGRVVRYTYDGAGNRLVVSRGTTTSAFTATIAVPGGGPINLRTLAEANGYTGQTNATVLFEVNNGATITGLAALKALPPNAGGAGGRGIDTGVWPTATYAISLSLTVKTGGKVYGGGGGGGQSGGDAGASRAGGAGGDAIYCQTPISIVVQSGGEVRAGGGGGGGGGGWVRTTPETLRYSGGGGGGGFPNGLGNDAGGADSMGSAGADGTGAGGGAGGAGFPIPLASRSTAAGGNGGGAAAAGAVGGTASGSVSGGYSKIAPASGGAAGFAIRKNGNTVGVTNSGAISGAVG